MDTLLRHWRTLQLIPPSNRHPISASQLRDRLAAEGYEVHLRTLQRDLQKLSTVFPIVCKEGKPLSWSWSADAETFDIPGMDTSAALTFRLVEAYLMRMLPHSCRTALAGHMKRARTILDALDDNSVSSWPRKVKMVPRVQPLLPPDLDEQVFEVASEALLREVRFKGHYKARHADNEQEYIVNPLGLIFAEPVVYLVATLWNYRERKDIRLLALHRFRNAELLNDKALTPDGFDLDDYLASGALQFPFEPGKNIKLRARFNRDAAAHLYESPLAADQKLTEVDDKVLLEATVLDTSQLRWWLLGFGAAVEVLAPKGLRRELSQVAKEMATLYTN